MDEEKRVGKVFETCGAARMSRLRHVAGNDKKLLVELHTWNAIVAASLLPTLHLAEVAVRNFALKRIKSFYRAPPWYEDPRFFRKIGHDSYLSKALQKALDQERSLGRKGELSNFITSELPFGFWVNIFTTRFQPELWNRPLHTYSTSFPRDATLPVIHKGVDDVRRYRNDVAHHKNVICKAPDERFNRTVEVLSWFCKDTASYALETALFPKVWAEAPVDVDLLRLRPLKASSDK